MVGMDEAFTTSEGNQSKGREVIRDILDDDDGADGLLRIELNFP